jgi:hypothetical protein
VLFSLHIRQQIDRSGANVFFVSGRVKVWWNARRKDPKTEAALLSGWYWSLGNEERGPFRSRSAAERDVYYRTVLRSRPPVPDSSTLREAEVDIQNMLREARVRATARSRYHRRRETAA